MWGLKPASDESKIPDILTSELVTLYESVMKCGLDSRADCVITCVVHVRLYDEDPQTINPWLKKTTFLHFALCYLINRHDAEISWCRKRVLMNTSIVRNEPEVIKEIFSAH